MNLTKSNNHSSLKFVAAGIALALVVAACGSDSGSSTGTAVPVADSAAPTVGTDAPPAGGTEAPDSAAETVNTAAPADEPKVPTDDATPMDVGYAYASNVDSHRLVVVDVCDVKDLLDVDPNDFDAINMIYTDGKNSVKDDGVRTIAGFATGEDKKHGLSDFYGTPAPLDEFVSSAIAGTGVFEGASDDVRSQGVEKGIQNQIMVAWVVHELNSAIAKAQDGNFDVAKGAVHNWDEGWAFYAGAEPGCGPYGTADKRGENFGTLTDGGTSVSNEAILAAMISGRDALLASNVAGAEAAAADVVKNVAITYSQAVIRYATKIIDDMAAGDSDAAAKHAAEGLAFWRVIEAYVVPAGADGETINAIFALDGDYGSDGGPDEVRNALQPALDALGITDADIGTLS